MLVLKQIRRPLSMLIMIWMVMGLTSWCLLLNGNVFKDYMITDIYTISRMMVQVIRLTDGLQLEC